MYYRIYHKNYINKNKTKTKKSGWSGEHGVVGDK
jgi:hypothetical protein